ncbi:hypothetical protein [Facklamia sp. P9177]|uniref:hypothetical protein n=1 Tax=Facklamia sp. P9177 TaxID=3421945 RepID=UPI003D1677AC
MNQRFLKGSRDSLGVPLEPDELLPIYYDWEGEAIYPGEEYYETPDGKVLADNIEDYLGRRLVAGCE